MKSLIYSLEFALSNKYFEIIIQCLEPKIFNVIVEVLFGFIIWYNKTSTFLLNILGSRNFIMTYKYLFERTKSRI